MPRRNSSSIKPITLAGRAVGRMTATTPEPDAAPIERERINWRGIYDALELTAPQRQYLELKHSGESSSRQHMASLLAWTVREVDCIRKSVEAKLQQRNLHGRRGQFTSVVSGADSRRLFYRRKPSSYELAMLTPEFLHIMQREWLQPVFPKVPNLGGTYRMETKNLAIEIKTDDAVRGEFNGCLSPYNCVDSYGDTVAAGAYRETLARSKGRVPLLWAHRQDMPIGTLALTDSPTGLYARGQLVLGVQKADEAYRLLQAGAVRGLSIGFRAKKSKNLQNGGRLLEEVDLYEGSLVALPAEPMAVVQSVKSDDEDLRAWFRRLREQWDREFLGQI